jgi:hypothetical protein
MENDDYTIGFNDNGTFVITGVLRLQSPNIYDELFAPIRDIIGQGKATTIDLRNVSFLNSSGITALARLIIVARTHDAPFLIIAKSDVPWQKKSIMSLKRLWPKLEITLT